MNQKNKKSIVNRQKSNVKRGFSFVEVLVAIFVFSLVMVATAGIFGNASKGYSSAKAIQKDLEAAQNAMNAMAKVIRTSSVVNLSASRVDIYDYSQNKCIIYEFNTTNNELLYGANDPQDAADPNPKSTCNFDGTGSSNLITTGILIPAQVSGSFSGSPSTASSVGKITISMEVSPDLTAPGKDKARMQTTVSLRDYTEAGL